MNSHVIDYQIRGESIQIVEVELMERVGELKVAEGRFFHDIAPVLFFLFCLIQWWKILLAESGLSMRAK